MISRIRSVWSTRTGLKTSHLIRIKSLGILTYHGWGQAKSAARWETGFSLIRIIYRGKWGNKRERNVFVSKEIVFYVTWGICDFPFHTRELAAAASHESGSSQVLNFFFKCFFFFDYTNDVRAVTRNINFPVDDIFQGCIIEQCETYRNDCVLCA